MWGLAAATLVAILFFTYRDDRVFWSGRDFSADDWRRTKEFERYVFVDDLLDGRLVGLTRTEVKALLGHPSSETTEYVAYRIREDLDGMTVHTIVIAFDGAYDGSRVTTATLSAYD